MSGSVGHAGSESSDEEYFPTTEELHDDDPMETDEDENDDDDDDDYLEDEDEEEEDEEEDDNNDDDDGDDEITIERIIQLNNPGILRQLQQAIQRGIALRHQSPSNPSSRSHTSETYSRRLRRRLQQIPDPPFPAGRALLNSGEFGQINDPKTRKRRYEDARTLTQLARFRELGYRKENPLRITRKWIPQERRGRIVAQYDRHVYSGQFSHDGGFFVTASQDFKCRMYETLNPSRPQDWKLYKTVRGEIGRWTITDATLSHDNRFLAYSSITPCVYFARTGSSSLEATNHESWKDGLGPDESQTVLDFSGYNPGESRFPLRLDEWEDRMDSRTGIWSLRFSADGRELVAGASDQCLYVYDVELRKITLKLEGHADDINAVCFADPISTNVLFSGSDDSLVKVWDRRSMAGGREAGCLVGHMEGITFVSSKGDGRYVITNGKDQVLKLWDIRKMMEREEFDSMSRKDYNSGFDYRWMDYPGPLIPRHPNDCSITTYSGHKVLKTLIRCHFSPPSSTGQQYLYSGSEDGRVHIWNLDGTIARVIDVGEALTKSYRGDGEFGEFGGTGGDNGWGLHSLGIGSGRGGRRRGAGVSAVVRDVSWHPYEGVIVSSSWTSIAGESGAVTVHAWDGDRDE